VIQHEHYRTARRSTAMLVASWFITGLIAGALLGYFLTL